MSAVLLFTGRSVRRMLRTPDAVVNSTIFPAVLFVSLHLVVGESVENFAGPGAGADAALDRLVLTMIVAGVLFGSTTTVVGVLEDARTGFLDRVRTLPVPTTSSLFGAACAEAPRAGLAVASVAGVGTLFGFRVHTGVAGVVALPAVGMTIAVTVVWIGLLVGVLVRDPEATAPLLSSLYLVLLFLSGGIVPVDAYPSWLGPAIDANPMAAFVEALDAATTGDGTVGTWARFAAWTIAATVLSAACVHHRLVRGSVAPR